MLFKAILIILVILVLTVVLLDIIPLLYTWQSRIHIGRFKSTDEWEKKIVTRSLKWLNNMPIIRVTDNKRLVFIDLIRGNYRRNSIQYWQEASLLLGLVQVYKKNNDKRLKKEIEGFIEKKISKDVHWNTKPDHIEIAILAYAFFKVDWIDQKKLKPLYDSVKDLLIEHLGNNNTILYRKNMPDFRYVDTIGFICPFLVSYGVKFNNQAVIELAINQMREFNKYALLKDTSLPCHTYNTKTKLPVGLFGWGRGIGWYAIGLIDSWNELPDNFKAKETLVKNIIAFAKMAIEFQNENGSWNWQITEEGTRPDSSATATLAWFLSNASKIKEISEESEIAKEKALNYLMKVTRRNGAIDFSQGDTKGIGVYSQNFDIMPFTQGFTLRSLYIKH